MGVERVKIYGDKEGEYNVDICIDWRKECDSVDGFGKDLGDASQWVLCLGGATKIDTVNCVWLSRLDSSISLICNSNSFYIN